MTLWRQTCSEFRNERSFALLSARIDIVLVGGPITIETPINAYCKSPGRPNLFCVFVLRFCIVDFCVLEGARKPIVSATRN